MKIALFRDCLTKRWSIQALSEVAQFLFPSANKDEIAWWRINRVGREAATELRGR